MSRIVGILPSVEDSIFSMWLWLNIKLSTPATTNFHNNRSSRISLALSYLDLKGLDLSPEVEVPEAEERTEDRSVDVSQVVVAEVDGLKLVKLGEGFPGDLGDLVEGGVEELDSFLVFHGDLEGKF